MKFKTAREADNYLHETIYFAYPTYDKDGNIIMFDNGFNWSMDYWFNDDNSCSLEAGRWCIESKCWYGNDLFTNKPTFEECLIDMANQVYEIVGDDMYMDYFHCNCELDDINKSISESYWDIDVLFNKLIDLEERGNNGYRKNSI